MQLQLIQKDYLLHGSSSDSGLSDIATITQGTGDSSNYFTITPASSDSTSGGTFTLTIAATDGVNGAVNWPIGFTLAFAADWSSATQQAKIVSATLASQSRYGNGVAIDGDYAVVGAPTSSVNVTQGGLAYVYVRSGSSWTQQAILTNPTESALAIIMVGQLLFKEVQ